MSKSQSTAWRQTVIFKYGVALLSVAVAALAGLHLVERRAPPRRGCISQGDRNDPYRSMIP